MLRIVTRRDTRGGVWTESRGEPEGIQGTQAGRNVTFDALHTLVTPRLPIYVQYAQTFEPYLGTLDPAALKRAFKTALKQVQQEQPVYRGGAQDWWGDVIRRTAVGAGADPKAVDASLGEIVPRLLKRFSSREGYKLFDDSLPTPASHTLSLRVLPIVKKLKELNIRTGLISNTDARMRAVIEDLDLIPHLDTVLLSEEEGVEKPSGLVNGWVSNHMRLYTSETSWTATIMGRRRADLRRFSSGDQDRREKKSAKSREKI
ncbi:hypothetical protein ACG7TL_004560 [Trametes sanguinea]